MAVYYSDLCGKTVMVDHRYSYLLEDYQWSITLDDYARLSIKVLGERYLHRIIMQPNLLEVDHINGNPLDNRRENLRVVTRQQNAASRAMPQNTSGHRNVYLKPHLDKSFMVSLRVSGRLHHIGYFKSIDEALEARDEARQEFFGSGHFVKKVRQ